MVFRPGTLLFHSVYNRYQDPILPLPHLFSIKADSYHPSQSPTSNTAPTTSPTPQTYQATMARGHEISLVSIYSALDEELISVNSPLSNSASVSLRPHSPLTPSHRKPQSPLELVVRTWYGPRRRRKSHSSKLVVYHKNY